MRVALVIGMDGSRPIFSSIICAVICAVIGAVLWGCSLAVASPQLEALSRCAMTSKTARGFQVKLNAKQLKAGNSAEVDAIGHVLTKYPDDQVLVQVYSESEPIRDAEKIRDKLIENGVAPQRISLSGITPNSTIPNPSSPNSASADEEMASQTITQPISMWLEIRPSS